MVVFDAWALLAHLREEPAGAVVRSRWAGSGASICSVNLGEVFYVMIRQHGRANATQIIDDVRRGLTVVEPDWGLVSTAAEIKAEGGLSYADSFCLATAARMRAPLLTGDPEIIDRAAVNRVEVVDLRS